MCMQQQEHCNINIWHVGFFSRINDTPLVERTTASTIRLDYDDRLSTIDSITIYIYIYIYMIYATMTRTVAHEAHEPHEIQND